jgi:hypothetical protein
MWSNLDEDYDIDVKIFTIQGFEPVAGEHPYEDHFGQKFASLEEMCGYWGTTIQAYEERIAAGKCVEEALTTDCVPGQ